MVEFTFNVLHLGNIAELDIFDGNATAEDQSALLGSYRSSSDPASDHIATLTAQDLNADNRINSNDTGSAEPITFDLGSGPVSTVYDSIFNVQATVNFSPDSGEPPYVGLAGIIQTETGDLFFVMIDDDAGLGTNSLDDFPVESVVINSISQFGSAQSATASDGQEFVPCFSTGTQIMTRHGVVPVEKITIGDQVATLDNGYQTVDWIGHRRLSAAMLARHPKLRPIYIDAGALGDGFPERDLVVSPQHRMMLRSKIARRMTDEPEILVAAVKLVGFPGIRQLNCGLGIQYHHFACSSHQLVWANGALAETLFLGPQMERGLDDASQAELRMIMPHAFEALELGNNKPVRPIVQRRAFVANMLSRHIKNDMQLFS